MTDLIVIEAGGNFVNDPELSSSRKLLVYAPLSLVPGSACGQSHVATHNLHVTLHMPAAHSLHVRVRCSVHGSIRLEPVVAMSNQSPHLVSHPPAVPHTCHVSSNPQSTRATPPQAASRSSRGLTTPRCRPFLASRDTVQTLLLLRPCRARCIPVCAHPFHAARWQAGSQYLAASAADGRCEQGRPSISDAEYHRLAAAQNGDGLRIHEGGEQQTCHFYTGIHEASEVHCAHDERAAGLDRRDGAGGVGR